jgi:hypothetical protein
MAGGTFQNAIVELQYLSLQSVKNVSHLYAIFKGAGGHALNNALLMRNLSAMICRAAAVCRITKTFPIGTIPSTKH